MCVLLEESFSSPELATLLGGECEAERGERVERAVRRACRAAGGRGATARRLCVLRRENLALAPLSLSDRNAS
eukprot:3075197-Pleurochrysis_carterae.AAC.2